jgi:hypothetical protein
MGIPPELWDGMRETQVVEVWPEHETPLAAFSAMGTQWRIGMNGPTGLDYAALPAVLDLVEVPHNERPEVFAALRIMEAAALTVMSELRKG